MLNPQYQTIFLMGPTASGKTALAIALSKLLPVELISVDSALVYRGMNIGTGKPDVSTLASYPHHLIDIRDPWTPYSSAEFCRDVGELIVEIQQRKRIPLLVGGTMYYFNQLQHGTTSNPAANSALRQQLLDRAARQGWATLYSELEQLDPRRAANINPNDRQRIQRALEIIMLTGKPVLKGNTTGQGVEPVAKLCLFSADRKILHQRIEQRFRTMIKQGLINEVEELLRKPQMSAQNPALKLVGYRQVIEYLAGKGDHKQMIECGVAATRQLAKRQLTWLRNQSGLTWINAEIEGDSGRLPDRVVDAASDYLSAKLVESGMACRTGN